MKRKNEMVVAKPEKSYGMRVSRGDTSIEMSPEMTGQIYAEMINLGTELVKETGRVTVEYFKQQSEIYYGQLNAYVSTQSLRSEERRELLRQLDKLTDHYVDLISQEEDFVKKEELQKVYANMASVHSKLYIDALNADNQTQMPEKPNLLSGLRGLFARNKK